MDCRRPWPADATAGGKNGAMASSSRLLPTRSSLHRPGRPPALPRTAVDVPPGSAKWAIGGIIGGGAAAGLLAAGSSALALYFARRVITPARVREEDQEVLAVIRDGDGPAGHPRGHPGHHRRGRLRVLFRRRPGPRADRPDRVLLAGGAHRPARSRSRLQRRPQHGPPRLVERRRLPGSRRRRPAVGGRADRGRRRDRTGVAGPGRPHESRTWAIMVHGRGATRQEGLRAVRPARELGLTSLLISYRNDGLAPSAQDGRYGLGSTEWRDVEAAIEFALAHGARGNGALRLVHGRRHLPADRRSVPATAT